MGTMTYKVMNYVVLFGAVFTKKRKEQLNIKLVRQLVLGLGYKGTHDLDRVCTGRLLCLPNR